MKKIRSVLVIIPTRNDNQRCNLTIRSIIIGCLQAHQHLVEIVVVDDCGDQEFTIDETNLNLISRMGCVKVSSKRCCVQVGPAIIRDNETRMSHHNWVIFSDSHMTFPAGWTEKIIGKYLPEEVIYCSTFVASGNNIIKKFQGSSFIPYEDINGEVGFFNSAPIPYKAVMSQFDRFKEIPVIIGACYLINRQRFIDIGGYDCLVGYGSEEILLSLKNWMMGGFNMVDRHLEVIHHDSPPEDNRRDIQILLQNKLMVARQVLNEDQWLALLERLPRSRMLLQSLEFIDKRLPARLSFTRTFDEFCRTLGGGLDFSKVLLNTDAKATEFQTLEED